MFALSSIPKKVASDDDRRTRRQQTFHHSVLSGRDSIVTRKQWKRRFLTRVTSKSMYELHCVTLRGKNLDSDDVNYHETFSTLQRTRQSSHNPQRRHCIARRSSAWVPYLRRYIRNGAKYGVPSMGTTTVKACRLFGCCYQTYLKHLT